MPSDLTCLGSTYEAWLRELAARVNVHDGYASFARDSSGFLRIARFGTNASARMVASRANGNHCKFEEDGLLQTGKGILRFRSDAFGEKCKIEFVPVGEDISVEVTGCREYCGHGTYLDGVYVRQP